MHIQLYSQVHVVAKVGVERDHSERVVDFLVVKTSAARDRFIEPTICFVSLCLHFESGEGGF